MAERILSTRAAMEGERKHVTVLFADVKGSMELLADRDPDEARAILDPIIELMMEAVHRYEGTVNQVMGDGIMALFGAPIAHEDHAVRACYAILRMQDAMRRHADDLRRREGLIVQVRAGLNSGEVVVRSIGSDLRMDYSAIGQTTHLAARMEQSAAPGTALLTAETLRLAEGYVQVAPLGPMAVKGLPAPVTAYELTGAVAGRSRFQTLATRGLTKLVGRTTELDQLSAALQEAQAGHGQIVAVVGEAGVGKSRLYWEFVHSHRTTGCLILEAGSVSYGKATSYLPVIDLLHSFFEIEARDDPRRIREKVTGKLLTLDRALEPAAVPLLALLDLAVEDEDWSRLDPPQRRQRTLEALRALLLREAQVQPLVLVCEDLHWVDAETQALLGALIDRLPTSRLLLLVNYRPEYEHGWSSRTSYRLLRLDPLPAERAEELLDALLGPDDALTPLKRRLIARAEGNPFFLEESVRELVETGALTGERGLYRPGPRRPETLEIPASAQAVIASRIDRLPPEGKRLLQTASVIGKDVPYALLQAVVDIGDDDLRSGLASLQAAEFLYETQMFPETEYSFRHALTHEVAYGSVVQERRQALHARIVEAIETLYPERLAEHVERLGHHALRGRLWDKAVRYLRQAALKAMARSANAQAVGYLEQALEALGGLPQSDDLRRLAIDLRFDLRAALIPLADLERALTYLAQAERLSADSGDHRRLAWASVYTAHSKWLLANLEPALAHASAASEIAEKLDDRALRIATNYYLGVLHMYLGAQRRAVEFLQRCVAAVGGEYERDRISLVGFPAVLGRAFLSNALGRCGDFADATRVAREAMGLARDLRQPYSETVACWMAGHVALWQGDVERAHELYESAVKLATAWSITLMESSALCSSAYTAGLLGKRGDALEVMESASNAMARSNRLARPRHMILLAEAQLAAGNVRRAKEVVDEALAITAECGNRSDTAFGLRIVAEIAATRGRWDEADRTFAECSALADELDMRPLLAHCHHGRGRLYLRTGSEQRGIEHLKTALKMFREMDMRFFAARAEADLAAASAS